MEVRMLGKLGKSKAELSAQRGLEGSRRQWRHLDHAACTEDLMWSSEPYHCSRAPYDLHRLISLLTSPELKSGEFVQHQKMC
ncbi:hypothetical protein SAY86_022874 [Trapa natans]|uniref:Uncharacterized protein n=1 Tax=Trapa natans TaxID=22666 RepID=A0AAN7R4X6_TRANT|nr:hypothetical protein SAY86_022874 [Trapa natans]